MSKLIDEIDKHLRGKTGFLVKTNIEHLKEFRRMKECISRAEKFVNDVMPQIGGICIQDYQNMNELCILFTRLKEIK